MRAASLVLAPWVVLQGPLRMLQRLRSPSRRSSAAIIGNVDPGLPQWFFEQRRRDERSGGTELDRETGRGARLIAAK